MFYCSHFTRGYLRSKSFEAFLQPQQASNGWFTVSAPFHRPTFYIRTDWSGFENGRNSTNQSFTLHLSSGIQSATTLRSLFYSWFDASVEKCHIHGEYRKNEIRKKINGLNRTPSWPKECNTSGFIEIVQLNSSLLLFAHKLQCLFVMV